MYGGNQDIEYEQPVPDTGEHAASIEIGAIRYNTEEDAPGGSEANAVGLALVGKGGSRIVAPFASAEEVDNVIETFQRFKREIWGW
jgi:hypothetical protein